MKELLNNNSNAILSANDRIEASRGPFLAALLPFRVRSSNSKLTFFFFSGTETSEIKQF